MILLYFIIFWPPNGIPVYEGDSSQAYPCIINDGAGGVYVAWNDNRNGDYNIYAQRIDSIGNLLWTPEGRIICDAPGHQFGVAMIADCRGGAILCWVDARVGNDFDLYAQRVDANGNLLWQATGVVICNAQGSQFFPSVVDDGNGGIVIAWQDARELDNNIYIQRLDSLGNNLWQANGISICLASGSQNSPVLTRLSNNRYLVAWEDKRNGQYSIYGQLFDQNGIIYWEMNGKRLSPFFTNQFSPIVAKLDSNHFVLVWEACRSGDIDLYAQKYDYNGNALWDSNGVGIGIGLDYQRDAQLVPDSAGGVFISWEDGRLYSSLIHCQHLNGAGTKLWGGDGIVVTPETWLFHCPRIAPNGMGGVFVQWNYVNSEEIYAQNIDSLGNLIWPQPIPVCTLEHNGESKVVSDGAGGFYSTWQRNDYFVNPDIDIYLQRIYGNTGIGEKNAQPVDNIIIFPNPAKKNVLFLSSTDIEELKIYNALGIKVLQKKIKGRDFSWSFHDNKRNHLPAGIYFILLKTTRGVISKKVVKIN